LTDKRIAIKEGVSELQAVKTAIHEIAHAKLHDIDLNAPKDEQPRVDRRTREEDTIVKDEELDSAETQRVVNRALKENRRTIPGKISRLVKGKISLFGGKLGGAKTEDAATKAKRVKQKLEKHIVRFMPFLGGE